MIVAHLGVDANLVSRCYYPEVCPWRYCSAPWVGDVVVSFLCPPRKQCCAMSVSLAYAPFSCITLCRGVDLKIVAVIVHEAGQDEPRPQSALGESRK